MLDETVFIQHLIHPRQHWLSVPFMLKNNNECSRANNARYSYLSTK